MHKNGFYRRKNVLLAAALAALLAPRALAAISFWDGGGVNTNWDTAANWVGDVIPQTTNDVQFASAFTSGTTISTNGNRTVNSLIINTLSGFTLTGGASDLLTLTTGNITRNDIAGTEANQFIADDIALGANATWNIAGANALQIDGSISGVGRSLTKTGAGTLIFGSGSSYSGGTFINGGVLQLNTSGAGTGAITIASGAELALSSATVANTINLNGTGISGSGGIHSISDSTISGAVVLQSNSAIETAAGVLTVNGIVTEPPGNQFNLTKNGPGELRLTNAGGYSGSTTINAGTLSITQYNSLGIGGITVASGASLAIEGISPNYNLTISGLGNGGIGALVNTAGNSTWHGTITLSGNSNIGVSAGQLTINSAISQSGGVRGLTKVGPGTLVLASANAYTGPTNVSAGILSLGFPGAITNLSSVNIQSGSTLEIAGGLNFSAPLTLAGSGVNGTGALRSAGGGTSTWSGSVTASSSITIGSGVTPFGGTMIISGPVNISGDLTKVGAGNLLLSNAANNFKNLLVAAGFLNISGEAGIPANSLIDVSDGAVAVLAGGVSVNRSLKLNGNSTSSLVLASGTSTWAGPLALGADSSVSVPAGAELTISNSISGPGVLTKAGTGTLVLSGSNPNSSGGTIISDGTVNVADDARLGGAALPVTINGGKLVFTSSGSTARDYNLTNGRLQTNVSTALGGAVHGGFLMGPGTFVTSGASFSGVTALAGSNISASGATSLETFSNGGNLSISANISWDGGTNSSSGQITLQSNTLTTTAFGNDGVININNGGTLLNTANALTSGGGSRITINSGGTLNVAAQGLQLNGALLVNNGTITGTTNVNFGSLAKGAGVYGAVNVTDGGRFSPGNSPGSVTTADTTWGAGGGYLFEINDAAGTAGTNWDLWNINGGLTITAGTTTNSRFTISIASLDASNASANAANFNSASNYSWLIASTTTGITGFDTSKFTLDTSTFTNPLGGGSFALSQAGNNLFLNFNGVSTPPQWNVDASGSWSVASNWLPPSVPNGPTAAANFLGKITAPRTVSLDGDKQVQQISFDNANKYTIAPGSGGTLTIGDGTTGSIIVTSGSHEISAPLAFAGNINKNGPGTLTISGAQNHPGPAFLAVRDGQLNLNSNAGASATAGSAAVAKLTLAVNNTGRVALGANQDLSNLSVNFSDPGSQQLNLNSPAAAGAFRAVHVYSADLASLKTSLYAAMRNALAPGASDPTDGIFDSGRGLHANSGIGLALVNDAHGDPNIFIRLTRIGDLNLDGTVSISDFIDLASHFNGPGTWQEGDLNYDGQVTISDFIDLASNFNTSYSGEVFPISPQDQQTLASFAAANGVSVPEPTLAGFLLLLIALQIPHRRVNSSISV